MGTLRQIVVDCDHPASLARFWAAALDGFEVLAYDDEEIARLANLGLTPETDPFVVVVGPSIELGFQHVRVPAAYEKRPVHLDVSVTDRDAETDRLVALGATVRQRFEDHTWMLDPEGNDFCLTDAGPRA